MINCLTKNNICDLEDDDERWESLRLYIMPTPCGLIVPANDKSNTFELAMDSDVGCCALKGATIGTPDAGKYIPQWQFKPFKAREC